MTSPPIQQAFSVLIVDDDKSMRASLVDLLEAAGWRADALPRATGVIDLLADIQPDVILSDVRMPGMSGLDLLSELDPQSAPPLVLISAHGDIPTAVQAIQNGAYSFVEKPYDPRRLLRILDHAARQHRMAQDAERLKDRLARLSGLDRVLVGQTPAIQQLRKDVVDLADTDVSILLQGETGTGKELVARALHDLGARASAPFMALNCAALPEDRFEIEMFGIKGKSAGALVSADGGTVFLDEVCTCPLPVQAKLLRVIEDGQVTPLGADKPVRVDVRILSATNEDPGAAVAEGRLRQDLLYRINTMVIDLPSLRARRDDLSMLFTYFTAEYARVYEVSLPDMSHEDVTALLAHDWPGNVRELRTVAERRVLQARRGGGSVSQALRTDAPAEDVPDTLREAVAVFERELIAKAIRAHEGRMDAVAEALGIGRRTLNEKIVKLGLDKDAVLAAE